MANPKAQKLRKFPKAGTIGFIVLNALAKNPDLKTQDILPQVLKEHTESRFNSAHLAWYKHQVKVGNYILPGGVKAKKSRKGKKAMTPKTS